MVVPLENSRIYLEGHLVTRWSLGFALALVIASAPLTDVFWVAGRIPAVIYAAYGIATLELLAWLFWAVLVKQSTFVLRDWGYYFILLFLVCCTLVATLFGAQTPHSLMYFLWFVWIFIGYGVIGKMLVDNAGVRLWVIAWLRVVIFIVCVFALQDWLANNHLVFEKSLLASAYRGQDEFISELLGYIRLRGPVEEAAHFALFLGIFVPLSLLNKRPINLRVTIYTAVVSIAYVLSMSLGAWASLLISAVAAWLFAACRTRQGLVNLFVALLLLAACILLLTSFPNQLTDRIWDVNDISRAQRSAVYVSVISHLGNASLWDMVFGFGPAAFIESTGTNPISWYLLMWHDLGLPALLAVVGLYSYMTMKIARSGCGRRQSFLMHLSVFTSMVHYAITANFWHPWVWLAFPIILGFISEQHRRPVLDILSGRSKPTRASAIMGMDVTHA